MSHRSDEKYLVWMTAYKERTTLRTKTKGRLLCSVFLRFSFTKSNCCIFFYISHPKNMKFTFFFHFFLPFFFSSSKHRHDQLTKYEIIKLFVYDSTEEQPLKDLDVRHIWATLIKLWLEPIFRRTWLISIHYVCTAWKAASCYAYYNKNSKPNIYVFHFRKKAQSNLVQSHVFSIHGNDDHKQ